MSLYRVDPWVELPSGGCARYADGTIVASVQPGKIAESGWQWAAWRPGGGKDAASHGRIFVSRAEAVEITDAAMVRLGWDISATEAVIIDGPVYFAGPWHATKTGLARLQANPPSDGPDIVVARIMAVDDVWSWEVWMPGAFGLGMPTNLSMVPDRETAIASADKALEELSWRLNKTRDLLGVEVVRAPLTLEQLRTLWRKP